MPSKYSISYHREATKYLNRLEGKIFEKIIFQLLKISMGFEEGLDISRLKGFGDNIYRLRIGQLRVIYKKDNDVMIILVLKIGPRGDVYK